MYYVKWLLTHSRYIARIATSPERAYNKLNDTEKELIKNEGVDVRTTKLPY